VPLSTLIKPVFFVLLSTYSLFLYSGNNEHLSPIEPEVITTESHDANWFTQGLYHTDKGFFISSGLYDKSMLIYQTPKKTIRYSLPGKYFAEGLTVTDGNIYLLTWKENTLFIFDKESFRKKGQLYYEGEGWGLTHTANEFIMSNGSNQLLFRDKNSFEIKKKIEVKGLNYLNELEYVDGIIWANRWYDNHIYAIDSKNGCLLAKVNLSNLRQTGTKKNRNHITNGIAYDHQQKALWVTGKNWSKRFLIKLPSIKKNDCKN
jgi:glutamine cyclotransferase